VQTAAAPGVGFAGIEQAGDLREGGNLLWSPAAMEVSPQDHFAKFRASRLFADSQARYEPGWTTQDRLVDPQYVSLPTVAASPADLRLSAGSPAIDGGLPLPAEWPDPLRGADAGEPDIGVIPYGSEAWGVGVDGRIPLFGGE
jgi:hypothetical protein